MWDSQVGKRLWRMQITTIWGVIFILYGWSQVVVLLSQILSKQPTGNTRDWPNRWNQTWLPMRDRRNSCKCPASWQQVCCGMCAKEWTRAAGMLSMFFLWHAVLGNRKPCALLCLHLLRGVAVYGEGGTTNMYDHKDTKEGIDRMVGDLEKQWVN